MEGWGGGEIRKEDVKSLNMEISPKLLHFTVNRNLTFSNLESDKKLEIINKIIMVLTPGLYDTCIDSAKEEGLGDKLDSGEGTLISLSILG